MRNFRELEIWSLGFQMAKDVYSLIDELPDEEKYGFKSQMSRSAVSISANIAEGYSRSSNKEFLRYLEIALGSSFELETLILLSGEIFNLEFKQLLLRLNVLQTKINAFRSSVKKFRE